ncbi:AGE family epimerase/isomerase [Aquisphaera insulae]|uniref:AGE family epimerase/isomerase n=1 Tax=Aquisphaera insulae TaxID=2712864 RepID=UPI0013ED2164|nr:AGE family epimerase/isomerase [Aquisphaera insulae]
MTRTRPRPLPGQIRAARILLAIGLLAAIPQLPMAIAQQVAAVADLAAPIDAQLRGELSGHWYPHAIDREHGGFHQELARDWSIRPDVSKFQVYQARMTWTAAAFAEYSKDRREEYLGHARHGLAFLDDVMRDAEHGGFHWILDARGRLDPRLGDEKHVYGTSFVIYAASKLRAVGGDERALKVARDAFDWLEAHAHDNRDGGYFEALRRDGTPIHGPDAAPSTGKVDRLGIPYGQKTMNSHIHMLEALAELAKVDDRRVVRDRLAEVFALVRDRIAAAPGLLNLYLTRDWKVIPSHDSYGHDVETAFLLVEAAEVLGEPNDPRTWKVARSLVDHALEGGWDEEHGGFYDKGDVATNRAFDLTKVWWTQAEGLNALLLMDAKYGRETDRYRRAFLMQWSFIRAHMLDPKFDGWFAETEREGDLRGDGAKASPWKANYHTSRAMMNVVRMIRNEAAGH